MVMQVYDSIATLGLCSRGYGYASVSHHCDTEHQGIAALTLDLDPDPNPNHNTTTPAMLAQRQKALHNASHPNRHDRLAFTFSLDKNLFTGAVVFIGSASFTLHRGRFGSVLGLESGFSMLHLH